MPPFLTSSLGYYGLDVPTVLCACVVVYGELVMHSLPKLRLLIGLRASAARQGWLYRWAIGADNSEPLRN